MRDWLKVMLDEVERKQREADEQPSANGSEAPTPDPPKDTDTQETK
ncbi:MAG: hypothetical protein AAGH76_01870 [Pseudomonadota bacterium]